MKHLGAILGVTAALIGLITAIVNLYPQLNKTATPTPVAVPAARAPFSVTIDAPREGEVIRGEAYTEMGGTYEGTLPPGQQLWVVAKNDAGYVPLGSAAQVNRTTRRWSQPNVALPTPGRWQLQVYVGLDPARPVDISTRPERPAVLPAPPEGLQLVKAVTVERR